jgi:hypothetical protein
VTLWLAADREGRGHGTLVLSLPLVSANTKTQVDRLTTEVSKIECKRLNFKAINQIFDIKTILVL